MRATEHGRRRARAIHRGAAALTALALTATACAPGDGGTQSPDSTRRFTVAAVGDIACAEPPTPDDPGHRCRYDLVGRLVKDLAPDRFLALGDLQYTFGGAPDYASYYDRYFGSLAAVTSPTPGDSDWEPSPSAYFARFGEAAGPPGGYYSFDLGSWHIISLNSRDCWDDTGCGPATDQYDWLIGDLAAHPNTLYPCTLAFFHDPRFLSVSWWEKDGMAKGPEPRVTPLWSLLYGAGTDVVLGGNAHNYERWAPQDVDGTRRADGITEFVVGTGGKRLLPFGPGPRPRNLLAAQDDAYGALQLELGQGSLTYAWRSAPGEPTFEDQGRIACH